MATDPRVHALRLAEFGIPQRLRHLHLDDRASQEALGFVGNLREHLVSAKRLPADYPKNLSDIGRGLLWSGPPGTGKTTEMAKVLLECYRHWNLPVRFIAYADYISLRKEQWGIADKHALHDRWLSIQTIIDSVHTVPVLGLDDVGKEHDGASRFAANELDLLLRQRHRDALPTLVSTNVPPSTWGEVYNPSMGSFVKEAFTTVVLKRTHDRRK